MAEWIELLTMPFLIRALVAGVAIGYLTGFYGVFVIQRKMSFLGSGLAHAAFGGIALGLLLNSEPLYIAIPFTVAVSLAIDFIRERTDLERDTAIGILFALSMALGLVFLSMKESFTTDAFAYLFGSILAVQNEDLWIAAALIFVSLLTWRLWGEWALATLDPEMARGDGLRIRRGDTVLSTLLAVTIVSSIKIVGIILVSAFLVIPAATARLVSGTLARMTLLSIGVAILSSIAGLLVSLFMEAPAGASIILVQSALFGVAFLLQYARER